MDGFFVFQVAGASAVSIRSPGKGAGAVANGGNSRRDKEGLCCEPGICLRERMWEAEV